jgi:hypothetical protein
MEFQFAVYYSQSTVFGFRFTVSQLFAPFSLVLARAGVPETPDKTLNYFSSEHVCN